MKNISLRIMLAVMLMSIASAFQLKSYAQDVMVSYQTFYDQLSPYGQWVNDAQYGNVWVPNEAPGFRPYATNGNWVMTDQGNMWVSDVPWGWACYHYGRWTYNPFYGWVWIPGTEWAPAWVAWRSGNGYYGWAPLGPGAYPGSYYEYPTNYWVFVAPQYLYHPYVYSYYQPSYSEMYYSHTTYISETYVVNGSGNNYYYGPRPAVIEREIGQPVPVYHVTNSNAPGAVGMGGNAVSIYRPAVNTASVNTARPANVIRAAQPIGRPQAIANTTERPAFHQQMAAQNPAFSKPNSYSAPRGAQQQPENKNMNNENRSQNRPVNNMFGHQNENQTQNRTEPQNEPNRMEPQNNNNGQNNHQPQQNEANRQPQNNNQMNRGQQPNRQQQQHAAPKSRQEHK